MSEEKTKFIRKQYHFLNKSTAIPNKIIFCKELNEAAKLVLMALHAMPESWEIYQSVIAKELNFGRDKMRNAINSLAENGYLRRIQKREGNLFSHYEYEFDWEPIFKNQVNQNPDKHQENLEEQMVPGDVVPGDWSSGAGSSGAGSSGAGKPGTSNIYIYNKEYIYNKPPTNIANTTLVGKNQPGSVGGFSKDSNSSNPSNPANGGSVGGFSEKIKIYQCLEKVDILHVDKERLTKQFSEQVVMKAVSHCTNPKFKVHTSLDRSIFYFCKNPTQIIESKETIVEKQRKEEGDQTEKISARRYYTGQGIKALWQQAKSLGIRLVDSSDFIEISNERIKERVYFSDSKFSILLQHLLKKVGLEIPGVLRGVC